MKCIECKKYIVPPQRYNPETIRLCKCLDFRNKKNIKPVRPMKIARELELEIIRLVNKDESSRPLNYQAIPEYKKEKTKDKNLLKKITNLFVI